MIKRARRMESVRGFGIDWVAAAADSSRRSDRSVLRLENLDTNLPLPPEAVAEAVAKLSPPPAKTFE